MTTHPSTRHGGRWLPGSRVGWWAVALAGLALTGVVLLALAFALGVVESADSFTDNWLLTGWGAAILASGAGSVVAGGVAIIGRHERSRLVEGATLLGLATAALVLSEVLQGLTR